MPNSIEIQIIGNNVMAVNAIDGVKTKLGQLQSKANTTADAMTRHFKQFGTSLLAGLTVGGLASLMKTSIESFKEQEIANRKLEIALGRSSFTLNRYAEELQKTTIFSDELITESMSLAAAFTNNETQIRKIIQVSMDLAAAKGIDLATATSLVTKSIFTETNALSRQGIEVEGVKGSAERLETAIRNISNLYGGQATEQAKTYTGQLIVAGNEIDNLKEELGGRFTPILLWATRAFNDSTKAIVNFGGEIRDVLQWMGAIDEDIIPLMSPRTEEKIAMMTTYHKEIKILTEEEIKAEQKKLEVLKKQNYEYQLALTIMSNKDRLLPRGMEDYGTGVELIPAPSIDLTNYISAIDTQKSLIAEVTDYDMANWYLRSDVAQETFGNMAQAMMNFYQLTGEASKGAFAVFKGFAIAETLAATFAASMKIIEAYAIVPWYAYAQAGAVIALGLTRVAQISALQPGSSGGGGGGRSAPSVPSGGFTNNSNDNRRNYIVNVTINGSSGNWEGDKDRIARDLIYYIDKARGDGG